ncbi:MAG: flagellar basal-body MS-ring/collar protein FliF [Rhodosalinus sp.]
MNQFLSLWRTLSPMRRAVAVGAAVAVFAAVLTMARMAAQPAMSLLYGGLEEAAAGEVVRALEARGAVFDVRGDSIFVAAQDRDQLRMTLAGEGLPANTAQGYELLDSLTGFGTTSQMFDAAYWRAKEGELTRTIMASPGIASARVHIAHTDSTRFRRDLRPTASVAVTMRGDEIAPEQARAFRYLVASAVPGMAAEDVAVIDGAGRLVGQGDARQADGSDAENRAALLRERVLRLVEARVGPGNAVVEIAVEAVTEQETIRERLIDPESRVAIATDTEESTSRSEDGGGDVTVASNLPDGDAATGDRRTSSDSGTRERVNYEVSQTEREVLRGPGAIRRLTVAVLVGAVAPPTDGTQATAAAAALDDTELEGLRALVAAAVGFDPERGDEITIRAMPLAEIPEVAGTAPGRGWAAALALDPMRLAQLGVLALVTIVLALFVLRPMLARPPANRSDAGLIPAPAEKSVGEAPAESAPLDGVVETGPFQPLGLGDAGLPVAAEAEGTTRGETPPVDRLRELIEERREETMEILSSWLDDDRERA